MYHPISEKYADNAGNLVRDCVCSCGVTRAVGCSADGTLRKKQCVTCSNKNRTWTPSARAAIGRAQRKHGHFVADKASRTRKSWDAMVRRCTAAKSSGFAHYGARGISVCSQWLGPNGFEAFLSDMGERPEGKTLDRYPNRRGNYEPSNCRWATPSEQQANRDMVRPIEINGETKLLTHWAAIANVTPRTISLRIARGVSGEDLLAPGYRR